MKRDSQPTQTREFYYVTERKVIEAALRWNKTWDQGTGHREMSAAEDALLKATDDLRKARKK